MVVVVKTCPNRSNPCHECSVYCQKRYGSRDDADKDADRDADVLPEYMHGDLPQTNLTDHQTHHPYLCGSTPMGDMFRSWKDNYAECQMMNARNVGPFVVSSPFHTYSTYLYRDHGSILKQKQDSYISLQLSVERETSCYCLYHSRNDARR